MYGCKDMCSEWILDPNFINYMTYALLCICGFCVNAIYKFVVDG